VFDHRLWHVAVLATTLLAAAGAAILALGPLVFDEPPPGLRRLRPLLLVLIGLAGVLLIVEWTAVH
jgi:hypothetical protein